MLKIREAAESLKVYASAKCLSMTVLGFSSGLPLLLILGTLSFWLREAGVDLKTIGFFSWVGLVYAFKWVWAPFVDTSSVPFLTNQFGRRRGWLLASQLGIASGLLIMSEIDPSSDLPYMVACATLVAFSSATQDITLDAYRIESGNSNEQAAFAACYQTGYRLAMIWAGAGALAIAGFAGSEQSLYSIIGWSFSYKIMALSSLIGVIGTVASKEPELRVSVHQRISLTERFIDPFKDFFSRYGKAAFVVLALIAVYRISDVVMGIMANPFYQDIGYTKQEVAAISKVFGLIMTLIGAFVGGAVTMRLGVLKSLMLGAVLAAGTNLLFCLLSLSGKSTAMLMLVVSADNLAGGLATASFVAFLSSLTSREFSATQYALLSSVMLLIPKFLAGFSGVLVEAVGYSGFFITTAAMGIPVCLLIILLSRSSTKIGED